MQYFAMMSMTGATPGSDANGNVEAARVSGSGFRCLAPTLAAQ